MKILGFILAFLFLLSAAFVGLVGANKARKAGAEISALTAELGDSDRSALGKEMDIPSAGRLNAGGLVGFAAGGLAVILLVTAFAKKSAVPAVAGVLLVVSAATAAILPHVETGPLDGMAPRSQAIVALVLALLGAGGALLAARKRA